MANQETVSLSQDSPPSLPFGKKIIFALGQLGWSLAAFGVGNLVAFFYLPPEGGGVPVFPPFIFQGIVWGFLTIVGIITFVARLFDAVTNPLIASWSDRSVARLGRRRFFMAISALPFALFSLLIFIPISPAGAGSVAASVPNVLWLSLMILLLYFFYVMYTTPYTALISEYGHSSQERLQISTLISVTWALGFLLGQTIHALPPLLYHWLNPTQAFQAVIGFFAVLSAILMLLPVLFINEKKYASAHVSTEGTGKALLSTLKNKSFFRFVSAELFYWICLTIMQVGIVYFVTVLLGLQESLVSLLLAVMVLLSFVLYPLVNISAKKFGKKKVVILAFAVFAVDFLLCSLMGILPVSGLVLSFAVVIIAAAPIAIFGILPNVIVADIADSDGRLSGNFKAGIFFGVRTFEMNLGVSIANILFASLIGQGRSAANPLGVRLAAVSAGILCLVGLFLFLRYDEKSVA